MFVRFTRECRSCTVAITLQRVIPEKDTAQYTVTDRIIEQKYGKMPVCIPGNPQMIKKKKVRIIGARVFSHCPGKSFYN